MEFAKALLNIIIIISVYLFIGFVFESAMPLMSYPTPPSYPGGGVIDNIKYALDIIAYLFSVVITLINNVIVIMTFSYMPYPFNVLLALPINALLIYSIVVVLKHLIQSIPKVI